MKAEANSQKKNRKRREVKSKPIVKNRFHVANIMWKGLTGLIQEYKEKGEEAFVKNHPEIKTPQQRVSS